MFLFIGRKRRKLVLQLTFVFSILVCAYLLIYTEDNAAQINKGSIFSSKVTTDLEMSNILRNTPYLWRKFDLGKNETARTRIQAQQRWVQQLSKSQYLADKFYNKKKVMWLEDDASYFYWTDGRVQCPYAPKFEEKCDLRQLSSARRLLGPFRFLGLYGDAIISVRNWESKLIFDPPSDMFQIMQILEPPSIAHGTNFGANNVILASYLSSSDIPSPYLLFLPHSQDNSAKKWKPDREKVLAKVRSKTKLVAAIVSNCLSSERLDYIRELQKYVEVDVYGKCGNFSCPKEQNNDCLLKIETEYKFFLAFENSRCEEYITEKLFDNALQFFIVPVVRGGRPSDYQSSAPTNSYIHVDEFGSPEKVAEFLKYLDRNEGAYLQYFEWKGSGYISTEHFQDFFCRTCAMLYYADFVPPPTWNRSDIEWKDVNRCLAPNATRW